MSLKSCLLAALSVLFLACGGGGGGNNGGSPLPAPSALTVTESGVDEITISWSAPAGSFDGYELEARIGSEAFQKIHEGLIPNTYTGLILNFLASAPESTTYTFRLRAAKGTSFSPYSNEASCTRGPATPGQPLATYNWASGSVYLSWSRNTSGSDGIRIERAECTQYGSLTGGWISLTPTDPLASSFTDTSVSPNLYYTYRITNLKGPRASHPSANSYPVFTGLVAASWITGNYDSAQAGVVVTWGSSEAASADGVLLERSDSDASGASQGNWTAVTMPVGYRTTFLDQTVSEGGRYFYRVSNLYGATASTPCTMSYSVLIPLLSPIGLQVVPTTVGLQLSWQNRSTMANQVVIRRNQPQGYGRDIAILSPSTATYLDPVTNLGYYTYTVVAKNNGQEAASNAATAATLNPSDALTLAATTMNLPLATDASLRPAGGWAFATSSPFGVLSNNDPWPATFPSNAGRSSDPLIQVDRQGWPHAVYATSASYGVAASLVHLWYDGANWKSETMATALIPSTSANKGWTYQLDSTGTPQVLLDHSTTNAPYGGATASLSYLHKVNGTWVEESLAGLSPSVYNVGTFHLSLDDSDTPHVLLGNWLSVTDYVRTGPGAWTSTTVPTGSVYAGWYNFLGGLWIDGNNGWIFCQNYGPSGGNSLSVVQMKDGAWLPPTVLEPEAFDDDVNAGRIAISPDRSRLAILASTTLGYKLFHQAADGWHTTLVASPTSAWAWTMRLGFDSNQKAHVLFSQDSVYNDFHE